MYTKDDKKARSAPQKTPKGPKNYGTQFVPGEMTDSDKLDCKAWTVWDERADDLLVTLADGEYRVSVKRDGNGVGYLCFINCPESGHVHSGWTLSGRGSTPLKAIKQACYRHFVLFDGEWPMVSRSFGPDDFND